MRRIKSCSWWWSNLIKLCQITFLLVTPEKNYFHTLILQQGLNYWDYILNIQELLETYRVNSDHKHFILLKAAIKRFNQARCEDYLEVVDEILHNT